ncbi:MAG: hypothetical protein A2170_09630 [Deltaproteobacteria bacterium RBG_13_53_10]|nr:MAG: hypothetical protein A2170_09630 [Deltaproteobacteria bacterium RBG_13_53_10]
MEKRNMESKEERQILVFRLGSEELGLDISCVREVLRPQEICPLPKAPQFVEGVINLRGQIVALIDLRKKLHAKAIEDEPRRIIVCKVNQFIVGFTVNSLKGIIALSRKEIKPPPEVMEGQREAEVLSGIASVGGRMIPILNVEHLLTKKEAGDLAAVEP